MLSFLLIFSQIIPGIHLTKAQAFSLERMAQLSNVQGQVYVKRGGGIREYVAFDGMSLMKGDSIRTEENSSAKLFFEEGTETTLGSYSKAVLAKLDETDDAVQTKVKLISGQAWNKVKRLLNADDQYEIETPTAIMGVRGTLFLTGVDTERNESVAVFDGSVGVTGLDPKKEQEEAVLNINEEYIIDHKSETPPEKKPVDIIRMIDFTDVDILIELITDIIEVAEERAAEGGMALGEAENDELLSYSLLQSANALEMLTQAETLLRELNRSSKFEKVNEGLHKKGSSIEQITNQVSREKDRSSQQLERAVERAKERGWDEGRVDQLLSNNLGPQLVASSSIQREAQQAVAPIATIGQAPNSGGNTPPPPTPPTGGGSTAPPMQQPSSGDNTPAPAPTPQQPVPAPTEPVSVQPQQPAPAPTEPAPAPPQQPAPAPTELAPAPPQQPAPAPTEPAPTPQQPVPAPTEPAPPPQQPAPAPTEPAPAPPPSTPPPTAPTPAPPDSGLVVLPNISYSIKTTNQAVLAASSLVESSSVTEQIQFTHVKGSSDESVASATVEDGNLIIHSNQSGTAVITVVISSELGETEVDITIHVDAGIPFDDYYTAFIPGLTQEAKRLTVIDGNGYTSVQPNFHSTKTAEGLFVYVQRPSISASNVSSTNEYMVIIETEDYLIKDTITNHDIENNHDIRIAFDLENYRPLAFDIPFVDGEFHYESILITFVDEDGIPITTHFTSVGKIVPHGLYHMQIVGSTATTSYTLFIDEENITAETEQISLANHELAKVVVNGPSFGEQLLAFFRTNKARMLVPTPVKESMNAYYVTKQAYDFVVLRADIIDEDNLAWFYEYHFTFDGDSDTYQLNFDTTIKLHHQTLSHNQVINWNEASNFPCCQFYMKDGVGNHVTVYRQYIVHEIDMRVNIYDQFTNRLLETVSIQEFKQNPSKWINKYQTDLTLQFQPISGVVPMEPMKVHIKKTTEQEGKLSFFINETDLEINRLSIARVGTENVIEDYQLEPLSNGTLLHLDWNVVAPFVATDFYVVIETEDAVFIEQFHAQTEKTDDILFMEASNSNVPVEISVTGLPRDALTNEQLYLTYKDSVGHDVIQLAVKNKTRMPAGDYKVEYYAATEQHLYSLHKTTSSISGSASVVSFNANELKEFQLTVDDEAQLFSEGRFTLVTQIGKLTNDFLTANHQNIYISDNFYEEMSIQFVAAAGEKTERYTYQQQVDIIFEQQEWAISTNLSLKDIENSQTERFIEEETTYCCWPIIVDRFDNMVKIAASPIMVTIDNQTLDKDQFFATSLDQFFAVDQTAVDLLFEVPNSLIHVTPYTVTLIKETVEPPPVYEVEAIHIVVEGLPGNMYQYHVMLATQEETGHDYKQTYLDYGVHDSKEFYYYLPKDRGFTLGDKSYVVITNHLFLFIAEVAKADLESGEAIRIEYDPNAMSTIEAKIEKNNQLFRLPQEERLEVIPLDENNQQIFSIRLDNQALIRNGNYDVAYKGKDEQGTYYNLFEANLEMDQPKLLFFQESDLHLITIKSSLEEMFTWQAIGVNPVQSWSGGPIYLEEWDEEVKIKVKKGIYDIWVDYYSEQTNEWLGYYFRNYDTRNQWLIDLSSQVSLTLNPTHLNIEGDKAELFFGALFTNAAGYQAYYYSQNGNEPTFEIWKDDAFFAPLERGNHYSIDLGPYLHGDFTLMISLENQLNIRPYSKPISELLADFGVPEIIGLVNGGVYQNSVTFEIVGDIDWNVILKDGQHVTGDSQEYTIDTPGEYELYLGRENFHQIISFTVVETQGFVLDNPTVSNATDRTIELTWQNPTHSTFDYVNVYRNGDLIGSALHGFYVDKNLQPNTTYHYELRAVDTNGVESQEAVSLHATTASYSGDLLYGVLATSDSTSLEIGHPGNATDHSLLTEMKVTNYSSSSEWVYFDVEGEPIETIRLALANPEHARQLTVFKDDKAVKHFLVEAETAIYEVYQSGVTKIGIQLIPYSEITVQSIQAFSHPHVRIMPDLDGELIDVSIIDQYAELSAVNITWSNSTDLLFDYVNIYQEGSLIGSTKAEQFTMEDLGLGTYTFVLRAVDIYGNESAGIMLEVKLFLLENEVIEPGDDSEHMIEPIIDDAEVVQDGQQEDTGLVDEVDAISDEQPEEMGSVGDADVTSGEQQDDTGSSQDTDITSDEQPKLEEESGSENDTTIIGDVVDTSDDLVGHVLPDLQ